MPELPEVTTTVGGLNKTLPQLIIRNVWTDYFLNTKHKRKDNIKNKTYFEKFRKEIVGKKVITAERRGKNILINLTRGKTILIHMKMTGHLLYGKYKRISKKRQKKWIPTEKGLLQDSFNQFIHLVFSLSNGKHLAFSDMRKFGKVFLFDTKNKEFIADLHLLGPEPLDHLAFPKFKERLLLRSSGKIKQVLMDQTIIAGIGNIYSDEILWQASIHPEGKVREISDLKMKTVWRTMKKILVKGVMMGGDSMSDYRNIHGERGSFQKSHMAYRRAGQKCLRRGCPGTIIRKKVGGRSAHFCDTHQI